MHCQMKARLKYIFEENKIALETMFVKSLLDSRIDHVILF